MRGLTTDVSLITVAPVTVASQVVGFTPHLVPLLVLAGAPSRLRPPAADGVPHRRGQRT